MNLLRCICRIPKAGLYFLMFVFVAFGFSLVYIRYGLDAFYEAVGEHFEEAIREAIKS